MLRPTTTGQESRSRAKLGVSLWISQERPTVPYISLAMKNHKRFKYLIAMIIERMIIAVDGCVK